MTFSDDLQSVPPDPPDVDWVDAVRGQIQHVRRRRQLVGVAAGLLVLSLVGGSVLAASGGDSSPNASDRLAGESASPTPSASLPPDGPSPSASLSPSASPSGAPSVTPSGSASGTPSATPPATPDDGPALEVTDVSVPRTVVAGSTVRASATVTSRRGPVVLHLDLDDGLEEGDRGCREPGVTPAQTERVEATRLAPWPGTYTWTLHPDCLADPVLTGTITVTPRPGGSSLDVLGVDIPDRLVSGQPATVRVRARTDEGPAVLTSASFQGTDLGDDTSHCGPIYDAKDAAREDPPWTGSLPIAFTPRSSGTSDLVFTVALVEDCHVIAARTIRRILTVEPGTATLAVLSATGPDRAEAGARLTVSVRVRSSGGSPDVSRLSVDGQVVDSDTPQCGSGSGLEDPFVGTREIPFTAPQAPGPHVFSGELWTCPPGGGEAVRATFQVTVQVV